MKSKKHLKKNKIRSKTRKGGFFSGSTASVKLYPGQCDINQLTQLKTSTEMQSNYQMCCPKGMFGAKNTSPYCKQLDLNFQSALTGENNPNEVYNMRQNNSRYNNNNNYMTTYQGPKPQYDSDVNPTVNQLSTYDSDLGSAQKKKAWYKFWGGKKSKKRHNKKRSHRRHKK